MALTETDLDAVATESFDEWAIPVHKKKAKKGKIALKAALNWDDAPSSLLEASETKT